MFRALKRAFEGGGGFKDILRIALPLMGSMLSISFIEFSDKMLLGHYSILAVAAVGPASIAHLLFLVAFSNVIAFIGIMIAQYIGASTPQNVGRILWQGVWMTVLFSIIVAILGVFSETLFRATNQPKELIDLEVEYFNILAYFCCVPLLNSVCIAFFAGKGRAGIVTFAITTAAVINIPLNYILINGKYGFPELGIQGAALATVLAWFIELVILSAGLFTRKNIEQYHLLEGKALDLVLIRKILRYGVPSGMYNFLEFLGATVFLFLVGSLGHIEVAVINVAFAIDIFGYLPIVGLSVALSTIVGRSVGAQEMPVAQRGLKNSIVLMGCLRIILGTLFNLFPVLLFRIIIPQDFSEESNLILSYAPSMMALIFFNGFLDGLVLMFTGFLKGIGDTVYVMNVMIVALSFGLVIPSAVFFSQDIATIYSLWGLYILFKIMAFCLLFYRYRKGYWKDTKALV